MTVLEVSRTTRVHQPLDTTSNPAALLRVTTVEALAGITRSTIYSKVRAGTFPSPIKLGVRCTRWRAGDINQWLIEAAK